MTDLRVLPNRTPTAGGVDGTTSCGYHSPHACGDPADWHILWTPQNGDQPGSGSFACPTHMHDARQYAYTARHAVGPDCNMPGARWSARRCYVPRSDPANGDPRV